MELVMNVCYSKLRATKNTGFSLLELLLTLTILSILVTIGSPSFSYFVDKNQSDSAIQKVYRLYNLARSEAITRNQQVYFCGSNSGSKCDNKWHKFGLIFIDSDKNKKPSADEIIRLETISLTKGHIETRVAFGVSYTSISSRGSAKYLGSMVYCSKNGQAKLYRRLTWNRTGRPYLGMDRNNDGIIEGANGTALDC
jgi:type IV fimbrial biogenesis protein FimT